MKGGDRINQRMFMLKAGAQSRMWGLAWQEQRMRQGGGGEGKKGGNDCNSISNKNKKIDFLDSSN